MKREKRIKKLDHGQKTKLTKSYSKKREKQEKDTQALRFKTNVVFLFQLQRASSPADLQLRAILALGFHVFPVSDLLCKRAVPDFLPVIFQDVAETFEIALTRVHVAVGRNAHVDVGSCAGFYAQPEFDGIEPTVLSGSVPEKLEPDQVSFVAYLWHE